jgi:hypothetical protein
MKFSIILFLFAIVMLAACEQPASSDSEAGHAETSQEETSSHDDAEQKTCKGDSFVPYNTVESWKSAWEEDYSNINLAGEPVLHVRFGLSKIQALLSSCTQCSLVYLQFASKSASAIKPALLAFMVDSDCTMKTGSDTVLFADGSDEHATGSWISNDSATTYFRNWKEWWEGDEAPDGYIKIRGYTYSRKKIDTILALIENGTQHAALDAEFTLHPDTLWGSDNVDTFVIDVVLSDGGHHIPGQERLYADIARPCPQHCPKQ